MSVTLDDADIEWVQRRALHHLQLVNERTAEVRWKEFGYYGTFLLALLAAFWFRRGWIVNWLTTILLAIVLGMAWPSDANAQESSSTKSEAPNSKQNQLPISKSEAPNLKEAQDPVSDLVLRVSNLTPQFGAWFLDISEVSNLRFGAWSLRFAEVPSLGFRAWLLELVEGWFLTLNQQGRWYFDRGEHATAAGRFTDPMWKGLASYRSGDYATALTQFARLDTPEAFFLMRNCDARMKEFPAAVGAYDHALKGRPAFREAIEIGHLLPRSFRRSPTMMREKTLRISIPMTSSSTRKASMEPCRN